MKRASLLVIVLAYVAFVSLGLPDGLLGVGWPSISATFGVPLGNLGIVLVASSIGFLLSSFNAGVLVARLGIGRLLFLSCFLVVVGLVGYATAAEWWMLLGYGVVLGAGGGAIDAGLNTYAAANFSSRDVNWLHACYGLGAMLGPLLMTAVLSRGLAWQWGYVAVGGILAAMATCFGLTIHRWRATASDEGDGTEQPTVNVATSGRTPLVWLGVVLFFVYTGLEVTTGQWAYSLFVEGRSVDPTVAGIWVSVYWGSLTVGRVVFGFMADYIAPQRILRVSMAAAVLGTLLLWLGGATLLSFIGFAVVGFMLAPIFPMLVAQTPARLGKALAAHAIGYQVAAANLGVALIPSGAGALVGWGGIERIGPFTLGLAVVLFVVHEAMLRSEGRASQKREPRTAEPLA